MPPSSNNMYAGTTRRFKSAVARQFDRDFLTWALVNAQAIAQIRQHLQANMDRDARIELNAVFYFPRAAIITKTGAAKRNDTSNRIKALHDSISEAIGFDDSLVWDGSFRKRVTPKASGYVDVEIRIIRP